MATHPRRSLSLLFAILAACAGNDWTAGQDMSAALDEAVAENDRHARACAGAESMPDMMAEVTRHEDAMAHVMERMDDARDRMRGGPMAGMRHCSGPNFDHMSGSLDDVHTEMSGHSERMRAAEAVDAAQSECSVHTDAMRQVMHGMIGDLESTCMGG